MFDEILNRINAFWFSIRLTYNLVLDNRVPMWTKVIPILTVLYVFSPIDVIPDFLLILGQLDDVLILSLGFRFFEHLAPPEVVEEHRSRLLAQEQNPEPFEPEQH